MKIRCLKSGLLIAVLVFASSGCSSYKLQTAQIDGAPAKNPIKITENREAYSFVANTYLSVNEKRTLSANIDGHSDVNAYGVYQLNPVQGEKYYTEPANVNNFPFKGNNFFWNIPSVQGGFDIDLALSKHFSINGGLSLSAVNDRNLYGKRVGIAFFTQGQNSAARFDVGLKYQDFFYDVEYIEQMDKLFYENDKVVYLHHYVDKNSEANLYFSLTLNSVNKPLDYFLNISFGNQSFFSFSPRGDFDILPPIEHSTGYASISLGFFRRISEESRIIIGARYSTYDETGKTSFPDFFIQHDFIF